VRMWAKAKFGLKVKKANGEKFEIEQKKKKGAAKTKPPAAKAPPDDADAPANSHVRHPRDWHGTKAGCLQGAGGWTGRERKKEWAK